MWVGYVFTGGATTGAGTSSGVFAPEYLAIILPEKAKE